MKARYLWIGGLALLLVWGLWQWQRQVSSSLPDNLTRLARRITVQVQVGQSWGSGVLLARRGQTYVLVTNQHVLDSDRRANRYHVRTPDGQRYLARIRSWLSAAIDAAILEFTSSETYDLACLNPRLPQVGEPVWAAGFPFPTETQPDPGLVVTTGQVRMLLPQPLEGGYRLGYTNEIYKGMSGGPVLNQQGHVVALNGMHQPLWGDLYRYASGEIPPPQVRLQLADLSWGIPVTALWLWVAELTPACPTHLNGSLSR
ncbi:MAG: serine protease [Gloeomargarita sp. SKYBB_i_bin120]|nr:serine protease [Gloeomargarita sp. SKYG98]MCS7293169.1 serine protease [Gloeomargarita sp. SKYB120]MDW8178734.1 serine protease [Gloeomargarita sp. SKYBB_i_bin120]